MRTIDDLVLRFALALLILLTVQALAGCSSPAATELGLALPQINLAAMLPTLPEPEPAIVVEPVRESRANLCEPLDQPFCRTNADCSDGTRCVRPWWAAADTTAKVCAMPLPARTTQRWRAKRLLVYVDHVCKRSNGCEPNTLARYLGVLILRESTWQPGDRHRLNPDLDAAADAMEKLRDVYAGNPALGDPDRWMTGLGYFAQNVATWLATWDPMAEPEALCHEVISAEVHLRAARAAVRKLHGGVDCDGDDVDDFWGTSCEPDGWADPWPHGERRLVSECSPSWYDMSRVNSGSLCPGSADHRRRFEVRAERAGLDPWAPIEESDLGASISRDRQDEIAAELLEVMDQIDRAPAGAKPRRPRSR